MRKRVLFLINTLRDGGAEKILVDIVNNLDPDRYDVEVRLIYRRGVYLNSIREGVRLTAMAGDVETLSAKVLSWLLPRLPSRFLHRLFVRGSYDTEVAFLEGYATKTIAGAPNAARKLAWVHCDLIETDWINGVHRTEQGYIEDYKQIDEIVCVSEAVRDAFMRRFGFTENIHVRYNPVDDEVIRCLSLKECRLVPSHERLTAISMGRMTTPKNFFRLLAAVADLISDGYPLELWLLGDGEQRDDLEQYIRDQAIERWVTLTGYIANPYPYLAAADLYVCSSIYEGFSTAATEALVLGLPVLTTDVAGMREMLGDSEWGLIVENDDHAFEEGLKMLLDCPDLLKHYRRKAAERGKDFELQNRLREIEELL